jgi:MFS family permease
MDEFDYLAVLISIILGLGITQLLTGVGRWIEQRRVLQAFSPAMIWAGILLLVHVQTWWSMFGLRFVTDWTFVRFAMVLLQPVILYLLATIVLPSERGPVLDLRANYRDQRLWFFGLLAFLLVASVLKDFVVTGALSSGPNLAFHIGFFVMAIGALLTEREGAHRAIAMVAAISMLAYVGLLFRDLH